MQPTDRQRGRKSEIQVALWADLQRLERSGQTLDQLAKWLLDTHGIKASRPTMSRTMARVREHTPCPPEPLPELEPATDEDELKIIRAQARHEMQTGAEWRQRHSAMGLLMRLAELRRKALPAPEQPRPTTAPTAEPMTPEQEAAAVRAQLGKVAYQ